MEVAGELLDRLDVAGGSTSPGTLVRLSAATSRQQRSPPESCRAGIRRIDRTRLVVGCGDLAEQLVETAVDLIDRAHWTHRLGAARFNELDRDGATERADRGGWSVRVLHRRRIGRTIGDLSKQPSRVPAAGPAHGLHQAAGAGTPSSTRSVAVLIPDESLEPLWRARFRRDSGGASWSASQHDRRAHYVDTAQQISLDIDEPPHAVHGACGAGLHRLALLELVEAARSFTLADEAANRHADPCGSEHARASWSGRARSGDQWRDCRCLGSGGGVSALLNWAEHGMALAVRSVAATRLGRFVDADNDTESTVLSARRADAGDPSWPRYRPPSGGGAARGDKPASLLRTLAATRDVPPFAEFIVVSFFAGSTRRSKRIRPRWTIIHGAVELSQPSGLLPSSKPLFCAGNLEVVDDLFSLFGPVLKESWRATIGR